MYNPSLEQSRHVHGSASRERPQDAVVALANSAVRLDAAPREHAVRLAREVEPGSAVARAEPHLLLCDHRRSGLAERMASLEQSGWRMVATDSVLSSTQRLAGTAPEALVLDPRVEAGAAEILQLDRAGAATIPLLLLTDPAGWEAAATVLSSFSDRVIDVAQRDAAPVEVMARLQRLARARDVHAELRRLRHRAAHDDRTELLRPEAFTHRLLEHWSAAARHGHRLALAILDLDHFGQFNKVYDHTVGDRVIELVGAAIRSELRTEDVAGRLGGDEFGLLLPYTNESDAARVVQRLRERIRALSGTVAGVELPITASLGFQTFDGSDLESVAVFRRDAESALRVAKRRGGDRALDYRALEAAGAA